jgi:nucleotide-binding universal stress UspA family protein
MTQPLKSILCPIDFDELYLEALELSKKTYPAKPREPLVINVMSELGAEHGWKAGGRISLQQQARTHLTGQVPYEFVVRSGEVVSEMMAAIQTFEADLIVIPTHGHRGLKGLILGSVAERVIRESPIAVLTLRAR